ncbi:MAG: hypothetical protein ACI9KE_003928 [Polyangiales bacterium]|jgi:hypothetical protein
MTAPTKKPTILLVALSLALGCTGTISQTPDDDIPPVIPPGGDSSLPPAPGQEFVCVPDLPTTGPLIRRLTREEYLSGTLRITGVDIRSQAEGVLRPDPTSSSGFSNFATALNVQTEHARAYMELAEFAVANLPDSGAFIDRYTDCRDVGCFAGYVDALTADAFGTTATAEEHAAIDTLYDNALERGDGFDEAALDAVEVVLQSPRFLYHFEADLGDGTPRDLEPGELARRIAFLVSGQPADAILQQAAFDGELSTSQQITAQVDRLFETSGAVVAGHRYIGDWLELTSLSSQVRNAEHHPTWSPAIGAAMEAETLGLFDELTWARNAPFMSIFDADFTIATAELAEFYGLSAPDENGVVDLSDVPERGGLLTQGSVLALSGGAEASTVLRGLTLSAQMSCGAKIPEPPAGISLDQPPPSPGQSKRDYSEARVNNPECTVCHSSFEPMIWGLIRYDAVGLYAEEDSAGNFIPEDGFIRFVNGVQASYGSPQELGQVMAESARVEECMVLNIASYAVGRTMQRGDACSLEQIRDGFRDSDQTYRDLVVQVAISPMFRSVSTEPAEGVAP